MNGPFVVSYVFLWVLVVALMASVFVLYNIEGRRYLTSKEGRSKQGPRVGDAMAARDLVSLSGNMVRLPIPEVPNGILFAATECAPCEKLKPVISEFAIKHREVAITVICAGHEAAVRSWAGDLDKSVRVIADTRGSVLESYGIGLTPFFVAVDADGLARHSGIVNDELAIRSAMLDTGVAVTAGG